VVIGIPRSVRLSWRLIEGIKGQGLHDWRWVYLGQADQHPPPPSITYIPDGHDAALRLNRDCFYPSSRKRERLSCEIYAAKHRESRTVYWAWNRWFIGMRWPMPGDPDFTAEHWKDIMQGLRERGYWLDKPGDSSAADDDDAGPPRTTRPCS
jgi:hypothetical protein